MYHPSRPPLLATITTATAWTLTTMPNTRKPHRDMFHDSYDRYAVDSKALRELLRADGKDTSRIIGSMRATLELLSNVDI